LVDIGSDTTEVLVYEHDRPLLLKSLPYGSNDITNALALGLKITVEEAESVKLGILPKDAFHEGKSEIIIKKSLTKLFKDINKELAAISRKQLLPAGIILSGGGALTSGIDELAKEILCIPARRGAPKSVGKLSKHDNGEYDIPWSVAYGLAILGLERRRAGMYGSFGNVGEKMKGFLRKFFI
jgi:cell division protein FtsA